MCKVWKTDIHIIHGVNTGKNGKTHRLYTAKRKVIHKVIHRLWIMLITVTTYRVESIKIELVFVRVWRTVWINCGKKGRQLREHLPASLCKCAPDRSVPGQVLPRLADHGGRRKNVSFSGFFVILGLTKWGFMNIIEMMFSVIHVVKYCLAGSY